MSELLAELNQQLQEANSDYLNLHPNATTPALRNALVVAAGVSKLYGFTVFNSKAAQQFILVFDASQIPPDTAVADLVFTVAASSNLAAQWRPARAFKNGVVICNSSTQPAKTIGAADCMIDAQYA